MDKSHKINGKVATIRDWSDIPSDILSSIGDRLGLIELLSFRSACKDWRSSSSSASACIESFPNHKPWFLLYGENSQCFLYNQSNERYTMDIPELQGGATCIASKQGWLLLFQEGMIFFFCPFSRAKIGLPQFPCSELSDHVAAFSSPPTSEDCIVSVIHRIDDHKLEVNVIHRGANTWTNHTMNFSQQVVDTITCASYDNETFYYLDGKMGVVTFSLKDKGWLAHRIVGPKDSLPNMPCLPFARTRNYFEQNYTKNWLGLKEDVSISTCGTLVQYEKCDRLIANESIKATEESKNCCLKGIWLQPRFFQLPPNYSWSS